MITIQSYEKITFSDVKEFSQNYVGGSELQSLRKKIQNLSEETSNNLKRNVYQNYVQFIDTAKEISRILYYEFSYNNNQIESFQIFIKMFPY